MMDEGGLSEDTIEKFYEIYNFYYTGEKCGKEHRQAFYAGVRTALSKLKKKLDGPSKVAVKELLEEAGRE